MGRYSDAEVQAYIDKVKTAQGKTNTSGGTGGAGYNPSNDVNSEIYNINTGGYRNNPNQSYIDFGNSGVLGRADWLAQNPANYGGSEGANAAYNAYLTDYAKQNGINTEGLDLSNWEKNRDAGNAWNDERSKMSDEEQLYSYLQGLVDEGKISRDDATYISRNVYGKDAAGNYIDYATGWDNYSERKNPGGFTDLYDAYDQADAIMAAFNNGEFRNPNDLYAALDEWTSHHDEDMVTAMIQILDNEFAKAGWNVDLYDNYLPHWYDDVEVVLDGQEPSPNAQSSTVDQYQTRIDNEKAIIDAANEIINEWDAKFAQEALDKGYAKDSDDYRAYIKKAQDEAVAQGGDYAEAVQAKRDSEANVYNIGEEKRVGGLEELGNKYTEATAHSDDVKELVGEDLAEFRKSNVSGFRSMFNAYAKYLKENEPEYYKDVFEPRYGKYSEDGVNYKPPASINVDDNFYSWFNESGAREQYNVPIVGEEAPIETTYGAYFDNSNAGEDAALSAAMASLDNDDSKIYTNLSPEAAGLSFTPAEKRAAEQAAKNAGLSKMSKGFHKFVYYYLANLHGASDTNDLTSAYENAVTTR